ncbi:glycosyltransferase family 32 protein [Kingella negevensis]|uniref:Glycosyltransferase sugar-binding region containing DXD motif protein n=1 Tax=Kingella negevensis TaxID=1522312 RepID=A0A238TC36_9NEIS|nr:glycosyltransferase [Kingella negevensis]MDK4679439.1 glycosyltransferase [Kingella negevensis]MDK4682843.1 glycosyltransferase [Kingella negevensis]MDK4689383.1 glycosyltransferase [Kingella negevensis]MDK4691040.1 glycosyltransferase [Kingella negevensis]MDK4693813.1 glycosyltransferase [Kingella negevensis]
MYIHQIYISDEPAGQLPAALNQAVQSVNQNVQHTQHVIYFKETLREWIMQNYGAEMLKAFDKLVPYAFKADLARYLLLYKLGGWYFDISTRVINPVNRIDDNIDMIAFMDLFHQQGIPVAYCNGILYAKAGSPILEKLIDYVCYNISHEIRGRTTLAATGPVALGHILAQEGANHRILTGSFMDLTPTHPRKNRGYVFHDGFLFALHKGENMGGDLSAFGAKGTNNYLQLYQERKEYDPNIHVSPELSCKNAA